MFPSLGVPKSDSRNKYVLVELIKKKIDDLAEMGVRVLRVEVPANSVISKVSSIQMEIGGDVCAIPVVVNSQSLLDSWHCELVVEEGTKEVENSDMDSVL